MNDAERQLISYVCSGDIRLSQKWARIILEKINSQKDETFKNIMLRKLDAKMDLPDLPRDLQALLVVEDTADFPETRFLIRAEDEEAANKVIALYKASERLAEMGITYLPAMILHGVSGCGKTMLARYIAHKTELPFICVQFSNLISKYLGDTQSNVAKIFEFARKTPCVLCFDEIDAVGMARGQRDDVGEMSRIVIALMQELDRAPNNAIVIGTTNRFDQLDPALSRRLPIHYELKPLDATETVELARRFFTHAGMDSSKWLLSWCAETFGADKKTPASTVVRECTDVVVRHILEVGADG